MQYTMIPEGVLYDESLTPSEKLICCYIATQSVDGVTELSNLDIAKAVKCTRETVIKAVSKLEETGYLSRELVRRTNGTIEKRVLTMRGVRND